MPTPEQPPGRVGIGFDNLTLDWDVDWYHVDQLHPNLITSYTIDRGRQYELDRTDGGRAHVEVIDPDGILDPSNPGSPYAGKLEPLLPIRLGRRDPMTDEWSTRFRGFVQEFDYTIDPNQKVGRLSIDCVDIFEILQAIEMQIGPTLAPAFGDEPKGPDERAENIYFSDNDVNIRIEQVLDNAGFRGDLVEWFVVFTGNVKVYETVYSPGESVLTVIQEAADAEFPGVANVYTDRHGRLCFHGRLARFTPEEVDDTAGRWDFREWQVGDGAAVAAAPTTTAHIRRFAYNRGLSKVINQAVATPMRLTPEYAPLTALELAGQLEQDLDSQGQYGIRSWSAMDLLTAFGELDSTTDLVETKRFALYYVQNFAQPRNRITDIAFRSISPGHDGAAANWEFLNGVDISDRVIVTVTGASGTGGFDGEAFYVEGVHEEVRALNPDYDDVTLSLDLSPQAYFELDPWT